MIKKVLAASTGLLLAPMFALAQFNGSNELTDFGQRIINFINNTLVPFVFAVALLLFIYGVYLYFFYGRSEEDARKTGRDYILWSIIAFVVMVSVWGIVNLVAGGINLDDGNIQDLIPEAGETTGSVNSGAPGFRAGQ